MRRSILFGTLLLAMTGCATNFTAPSAGSLGATARNTDPMAARAVAAALTAGSAEDRAAALAGETADDWTPPAYLAPMFQRELAESEPATGLAATSPEFPSIRIVRFAKVDTPLFRGGLPSEADLRSLKGLGIKTDIDLMGEVPVFDTFHVAREKRWAKKVGLKFVQIKVPTGKVPLSGPISDAIATKFLTTVLDPANQPCYVHCVHGRDRTGTMAAVYRIAQNNFSNEQAAAEMASFGFDPKAYPKLAAFVKSYKPAAR